jgi:hypothetical protein
VQGYRFGAVNGNACQPANAAVVRPKERAIELYRDHFGDRLVASHVDGAETFTSAGPTNWDGFAGTAPYVRAYASLADGGASLRLIIVNRNPDRAIPLDVTLNGFAPQPIAQTWQLSGDSILATNENVGGPPDAVRIVAGELSVPDASFRFVAPAHSVTALAIARAFAPFEPTVSKPGPVRRAAIDSAIDAGVDDAPRDVLDARGATSASVGCGCASPPGRGTARRALIALGAAVLLVRRRRGRSHPTLRAIGYPRR